jgi:nucleoside-diphosphate-sugar epimerase
MEDIISTMIQPPKQKYESKRKKNNNSTFHTTKDYSQLCQMITTTSHSDTPKTVNTKATVLITGVLSHPLGVRLAKVLQTECSLTVSTILGIDPIVPKFKSSSARVIRVIEERMKLLYTPHNESGIAGAKFILLPIPFVGLAPRLLTPPEDNDWDVIQKYRPTHIVHLMSYTEPNPLLQHPKGEVYPSAYFQLRQRRYSLEQILTSIYRAHQRVGVTIPHLVYASSSMEDLLVRSYATLFNLTSPMVGLRFSPVYGPTGSFGLEDISTMATNAVFGPRVPIILPPTNSTILFESDDTTIRSSAVGIIHSWWDQLLQIYQPNQDWIHVDDATQSVLAAMQYYSHSPSQFHITSGKRTSLLSIALIMEQHLPRRRREYSLEYFIKKKRKLLSSNKTVLSQLDEQIQDESLLQQLQVTKQSLGWEPQISIQNGISQMLHWYFYQRHKHGPTMQEVSAYALPSPLPIQPYIPYPRVPCSSECALSNFCLATDTDSLWSTNLLNLSHKATQGCEIVFYVVNLNEITIEEYMADSSASPYTERESLVCKVAFVQKQSDLVQSYFQKHHKEHKHASDKIGRFTYGEFHIIWTEIGSMINPPDLYYAKIAPRSLFAESTIFAMYMDFFSESYPSTDEILHLVARMMEEAQDQRSKTIGRVPGKKKRVFIPATPSRRAVMLLQTPVVYDDTQRKEIVLDKQIMKSLHHVMLDLDVTKDTPQRKAQGQFYDLVHQLMEMEEFRDLSEWDPYEELVPALYAGYVIHDLLSEEGRQLRCDWYKEHLLWNGSELEDRSLSYVLYQRAWAGRHGVPLENNGHLPPWLADLGWIPILQPLYNLTDARFHYPYAITSASVTGSRMYYNQILDGHGEGLYVRLTRETLPKSLTEALFDAARTLEQLEQHPSSTHEET